MEKTIKLAAIIAIVSASIGHADTVRDPWNLAENIKIAANTELTSEQAVAAVARLNQQIQQINSQIAQLTALNNALTNPTSFLSGILPGEYGELIRNIQQTKNSIAAAANQLQNISFGTGGFDFMSLFGSSSSSSRGDTVETESAFAGIPGYGTGSNGPSPFSPKLNTTLPKNYGAGAGGGSGGSDSAQKAIEKMTEGSKGFTVPESHEEIKKAQALAKKLIAAAGKINALDTKQKTGMDDYLNAKAKFNTIVSTARELFLEAVVNSEKTTEENTKKIDEITQQVNARKAEVVNLPQIGITATPAPQQVVTNPITNAEVAQWQMSMMAVSIRNQRAAQDLQKAWYYYNYVRQLQQDTEDSIGLYSIARTRNAALKMGLHPLCEFKPNDVFESNYGGTGSAAFSAGAAGALIK